MILLDTDVCIDVLRGHPPALAWLRLLNNQELHLPGFVAMELLQGCRDKKEQARVEEILQGHTVLWPDADMCNAALATFSRFNLSHGLGIIDALIGQLAVALDALLYSFNRKHYAMVPHLRVEEPYAK
jgi:hypothetical protein